MKLTQTLIASAVLLATSSVAMAAVTTSTDITINVTKNAYINLVGSLAGNQSLDLTTAQVDNTTTTLGTLGAESNSINPCDITFASAKDFKLEHETIANEFLHGAGQYTAAWNGTTISSGGANAVTVADCNIASSNFTMTTPALPAVVKAGKYSDVLSVTITTP